MTIKTSLIAISLTCLISSSFAATAPTWETQITIPSGSIQSIKSDKNLTVKQTSTDSILVTTKNACSSNISSDDPNLMSKALACLGKETGDITLTIKQVSGNTCSATVTETLFGGLVSVTQSNCDDISVGDFDNQTDGMDYTLSSDYTGLDW